MTLVFKSVSWDIKEYKGGDEINFFQTMWHVWSHPKQLLSLLPTDTLYQLPRAHEHSVIHTLESKKNHRNSFSHKQNSKRKDLHFQKSPSLLPNTPQLECHLNKNFKKPLTNVMAFWLASHPQLSFLFYSLLRG